MLSTSELIEKIKAHDLPDRLAIIQAVVKDMEPELKNIEAQAAANGKRKRPTILELAGTITEEDAKIFEQTIKESRQASIHDNAW